MKKYWIISFVFLVLLLSACGREAAEADWEPTTYDMVNDLPDVTMTVIEETITPSGLTVQLKNDSDKECLYSADFVLEKNIDGKWYQVPVVMEGDIGFEDIGYPLEPGDESEWTVDWEWLYSTLDEGRYRIVKVVLDFRGTGDFDSHHLAAEFEIEG